MYKKSLVTLIRPLMYIFLILYVDDDVVVVAVLQIAR